MQTHLHRVEVERAVTRDHDLAVERGFRRQQLAERSELGEVAEERPLVARPQRELAADVLEHSAEPVPLRFVLPAVSLRQLTDELGLHGRERDGPCNSVVSSLFGTSGIQSKSPAHGLAGRCGQPRRVGWHDQSRVHQNRQAWRRSGSNSPPSHRRQTFSRWERTVALARRKTTCSPVSVGREQGIVVAPAPSSGESRGWQIRPGQIPPSGAQGAPQAADN